MTGMGGKRTWWVIAANFRDWPVAERPLYPRLSQNAAMLEDLESDD
jgi:hypothetical protein